MLSLGLSKRLIEAVTSAKDGNELIAAINNSAWGVAAAIVAAHVSATTDFAALLAGDLLVHIPATAGNAAFEKIVTALTLPLQALYFNLKDL